MLYVEFEHQISRGFNSALLSSLHLQEWRQHSMLELIALESVLPEMCKARAWYVFGTGALTVWLCRKGYSQILDPGCTFEIGRVDLAL
jgi:hypothetical protein